jgi:hypothetical protein
MRARIKCALVILAATMLWQGSHGIAAGERVSRLESSPMRTVNQSGELGDYTGILRVYVTEITGRWNDDWGGPFHNAFLAFALEDSVSLSETDTLTWELEWDGHDYSNGRGSPYDDLQEDNVKVIAAVFNSAGYPGYSYPPSGEEFTVHEVDACAESKCGSTGYNLVTDNFTHSILVEDGTSTW